MSVNMAFRDTLITCCTDKAKTLGRKLTSLEVVECACECHAKATKERKKAGILPDAEQVYALYPRKINPEDAKIAITKALKKRELSYLLDKTNQFAEAVNSWPSSYRYGKDGRDLCPYGSSWFNSGGYDSDPKEWKRFGARNAAPHQHVSPPEPLGWKDEFPDFLHADKPWQQLDPASQQHIILTMAAKSMTSTAREVDSTQALREA